MKKFSAFLNRLLKHLNWRYPLLMILMMQIINTPLLVFLTLMPTQDNAEFSREQAAALFVFGCLALVFRNIVLFLRFYFSSKALLYRLSDLEVKDPQLEKQAWEQANSASKRYTFSEMLGLFFLVLIPIFLFGYWKLGLEIGQLAYLSASALAAGIVNLLLGYLVFDKLFEPVIQVLLPGEFDSRLSGRKGMRLFVKYSLSIVGVVLIGFLLTIPTAYHQVDLMKSGPPPSPQFLQRALGSIIKAGIGAIFIGSLISIWLLVNFTEPFRKMIRFFRDVEEGDLSRRIEVSSADEFGELNIHLNHMIERLQEMTTHLEQQVAERTQQLSQVNEQLLVELTERKRTEEQLAYTALHDPLTDLPNRSLFLDRLSHVLERSRRHKNLTYSVIFIDLDRFKVVNDSLGHNVGDLLLIESARRLSACVRSEDTVARLGGDEFVILLEEMENSTDYLLVADRIQQELAAPADLGGHKAFISISMGIVLSSEKYDLPEDVLRDADIAMYRAKRQGRGRYIIFDPSMLEGVMSRMELENDLRKALENKEFVVHYQPILELTTRHIEGFEALVRWQHPTRGLILPEDFISLAEEAGLIVPIGYWVLDEACRQLKIWQERFPSKPSLTMNVNLSTRQCVEIDLIEKIITTLKKYDLDTGSLKLELTESLIIEDSEYVIGILSRLRELGIQVQIDDFGTGYSSLGYLNKLPIDTLKIDRTFISQMGKNQSGREIVHTILALAHGMGMKVIAEGVETEDQLANLKEMNCEYAQGFLFARPVDEQKAAELLEGNEINDNKTAAA